MFNSVIFHNLSENPNLIYGILTAHKAFEDLGTFTLSRGLREIRRVQLAKEEQARKADRNPKSRASVDDEEPPHEEKSRLLENESDVHEITGSLENLNASPRHSEGQEEQNPLPRILTTQPLMSPPLDGTMTDAPSSVSEKVRGKMKARRSLSLDTTSSLDRIAAAGVGRNGFVPSQEWVSLASSWLISPLNRSPHR